MGVCVYGLVCYFHIKDFVLVDATKANLDAFLGGLAYAVIRRSYSYTTRDAAGRVTPVLGSVRDAIQAADESEFKDVRVTWVEGFVPETEDTSEQGGVTVEFTFGSVVYAAQYRGDPFAVLI